MNTYRNILLAIDFVDQLQMIVDRAHSLTQQNQARLTILHVVEYIPLSEPVYGSVLPMEADLTEQLVGLARKRMTDFKNMPGLSESTLRVEVGNPKAEIVRVAKEIGADLIIVGSHGRQGIGVLLGSTASSVMHHARCDVLAVRLLEE